MIVFKLLILVFIMVSTPLSAQTVNQEMVAVELIKVNTQTKKEWVDGVSSASQLRAKRSHSAATENETKLTVFLALLVIAVIVFFALKFGNKR